MQPDVSVAEAELRGMLKKAALCLNVAAESFEEVGQTFEERIVMEVVFLAPSEIVTEVVEDDIKV
jgi:hypothetical protein